MLTRYRRSHRHPRLDRCFVGLAHPVHFGLPLRLRKPWARIAVERDAARERRSAGLKSVKPSSCAASVWQLSHLQCLLPPEADLAMKKHRWRRRIVRDEVDFRSPGPLLAHCGGSRQCSRMSAMEGTPDGRRMRPGPPLGTQTGPSITGHCPRRNVILDFVTAARIDRAWIGVAKLIYCKKGLCDLTGSETQPHAEPEPHLVAPSHSPVAPAAAG
jgi:hypothetical protein